MPYLTLNLELGRCPHCSVACPNLMLIHTLATNDHAGRFSRVWGVYKCLTCGGVVLAWAKQEGGEVDDVFPSLTQVNEDVPERPRAFLQQACESIHAPAGAVMLAASAVDSMLKTKGYLDGSLYARIENAASDHVITADMAAWAHEVRLEANDQRHADQSATLPTGEDAVIDFASALAEILFVLPSRIERGRHPVR